MNLNNIEIAFFLTLFAGLATGVGSVFVFFAKRTDTKFLSVSLGFSAGMMIYVSFVEMLPYSEKAMQAYFEKGAFLMTLLAFFGGIVVIALIDRLIPEFENPHEAHKVEEVFDKKEAESFRKLHHVGICTAIAIAIHNFPEGMITFVSSLSNVSLGVVIAVAVALHNIPEGISISIPIYYATGSKKKAFFYSLFSGLTEPMGALLAFLVFREILNDLLFGILFGAIAGIMVFISFDELLPAAKKYGEYHLAIYGLILGMALMAFSLFLLG
ncbi:zinc transporter ZupT [Patescibacteria group bacterium]|nr:zinc transporter ZupT [Patescibacteria group bacterium]